MSESHLSSSIQQVKGVGPKLSRLLQKKGIFTLEDALYFLPRTYEDRRAITPISKLKPNANATVLGSVFNTREIRKGRNRRFEVILGDSSGQKLLLVWFHAYPSLIKEFATENRFLVYGNVKYFGGRLQMAHPDYEQIKEEGRPRQSANFGRVVPVYSETEGLHQKTLRRLMGEAIRSSLSELEEVLPEELLDRLKLPNLRDSFAGVHFPKDLPKENELSVAHRRIVFEEFFILQLGLGLKKIERAKQVAPKFTDTNETVSKFLAQLPFEPTGDQSKVLAEVVEDLNRGVPMARLIQGDVGSGKTVVAMAAACLVAAHGYQIALMVPTEILALQHHKTAQKWLEPLGIRCELLVQSTKKEVATEVKTGDAQFIVGTHALFQKGVQFKNLGLVVVDEQHRFGVEQRSELLRKGGTPHLLMMTATPIPRTLALTLYGDLSLSVIRERPVGRKPIETNIIREHQRPKLYQYIRKSAQRGEQSYIIYPLVDVSEKLDLKSATEMYHRLQREIFPDLKIALLHGKMKSEDKERILAEFRDGKYHVLVSTTVIEVGIDVPQATLMVIEHPERLGLSQLHQLRGRVGRGALQSRCVLVAEKNITRRLKVMEQTNDGFKIAEEDLEIRGPGEFLGIQQSGLPGFRVGHIVRDASLLELAQTEANRILAQDEKLTNPAHKSLKEMVEDRWREKLDRLRSG